MGAWFIRCNGQTAHNQPGTPLCVEGEPPQFPEREFNYIGDCLRKGFARVGWPAAGDLRDHLWRARAASAYGGTMREHHVRYLEQFVGILPNDVVLVPTYQRRYQVHLGVVTRPRNLQFAQRDGLPYYYYYDVPAGDRYENAHRVDVTWARSSDGTVRVYDVPEIGGTWIRGFGAVKDGGERVRRLVSDTGLLHR